MTRKPSYKSFFLTMIVLLAVTSLTATAFAAGPNVLKNAKHDTSAPLAQLVVGSSNPKAAPDKEAGEPKVTGPALNSGKNHSTGLR